MDESRTSCLYPASKLSISSGESSDLRENTRASGKAARASELASPLACHSRVTSNDIAQMESSLAGFPNLET